MLHILAATDFSEVADHAVQYACKLAEAYNGRITVIHSFIIPVTFSDTPMPVIPVDEGKQIAEERLSKQIASLKNEFPQITIESKVLFGDVVDSVHDYLEEAKADLIVLGNSSTEDSFMWLGGNIMSAVRNLSRIVIAVPKEAYFKKVEKLCFACDLKNIGDHLPIEDFNKLISFTNAELHVLNVDQESRDLKPEAAMEGSELHQFLSNLNPVFHYVESEHLEDAIQHFVEQNHMDWLVVLPHKHGFFEGMFHKSRTKQILRSVHVPLVALHEK